MYTWLKFMYWKEDPENLDSLRECPLLKEAEEIEPALIIAVESGKLKLSLNDSLSEMLNQFHDDLKKFTPLNKYTTMKTVRIAANFINASIGRHTMEILVGPQCSKHLNTQQARTDTSMRRKLSALPPT